MIYLNYAIFVEFLRHRLTRIEHAEISYGNPHKTTRLHEINTGISWKSVYDNYQNHWFTKQGMPEKRDKLLSQKANLTALMVIGSSVNKLREQQEQINQKIESLVSKYKDLEKSKSPKEMHELSEANVRADFIDPLFDALDWDVGNPKEYDREYSIKHGGRADIALKIENKPVAFIEVKRFGGISHVNERGDGDWLLEERQTILYAAKEEVKWAILTNFEKFRVFNARTGLTILDFESIYDYRDRFGELLYLTKDAVETGRIERLAERKERPDIDLEFLELLKSWRIELANDIYSRNRENEVLTNTEGQFDSERLKDAVQRILDRLIIVRWAEDNLVLEDPNILLRKYDDWKLSPAYNSIVDSLFADRALFDKFNEIHDGKIFERGHICERVRIGDETLGAIIHKMNQMSFRKFDFDILGNTYETYLGHTLYFKDDGTLDLKPSQGTRKESGIYYTPPYVVDYIVKNTLGELLKDKTPEEVEKIRVLDPACGSGSFLIKAFDYLKGYYVEENKRIRVVKGQKIKEYLRSSGNQFKLDEMDGLEYTEHRDIEKKILKNNIFGVDLDRQAAEIASVNLMLKALKPKEKLPLILDENIRVGNSLISGTEEELKEYFGESWGDKKPFNWGEAFGEAGFDVVVGNPPWVFTRGEHFTDMEKSYFNRFKTTIGVVDRKKQSGKLNLFSLFLKKGIELLEENGFLGLIVPNNLLRVTTYDVTRKFILDTCKIIKIIDLSGGVFREVTAATIIILLEKEKNNYRRNKNEIEIISEVVNLNDGKYKTHLIEQETFLDNVSCAFNIYADKRSLAVFSKMKEDAILLGELTKDIIEGIVTPKGKKDFISVKKEGEKYKKFLEGKNIGRYCINYENKYILYDRNELHRPRPEEIFIAGEKILIQRIGGGEIVINAVYDNEQYYTFASINNLLLEKGCGYDVKYILAVLNSKLVNFYYRVNFTNKSDLTVNISKTYLEQLPIALANPSQQKPLIELADRILTLNKELNTINTDFDRYLNLNPRTKDTTLKDYIDKLPVSGKEVLKDHYGKAVNLVEGKIKEFEIAEEGEWLVFKVGYIFRTSKGKETLIKNVRAFRCRIEDVNLKKFLYYSIKEYTTPGKVGKGNIYDLILKIKVPGFNVREEDNKKVIDEVMSAYLVEVEKREKVEREIDETDREIDRIVYELYGLSEEEIGVVEG
jgi:type I restriction-modification system DNA methylase subunit